MYGIEVTEHSQNNFEKGHSWTGTGEPGGLPSMGSHRVGHDWNDLAAAAVAELIKERGKAGTEAL